MRIDKVSLLGRSQARERIEVSSKPAIIFREQAGNEIFRRFRTRSREVFPGGFRWRSSRYDHASIPDGDVTAIKIKHRREWKQSLYSGKLPKRQGSLGIHPRHCPVEARQQRIIEQGSDYIVAFATLFTLRPVFRRKQQWNLGCSKRTTKSFPAPDRLLELCQRKSGINCQKRPFRVGSFERGVLSASLSKAVAEDCQQGSGLFTIGNADHALGTSQRN